MNYPAVAVYDCEMKSGVRIHTLESYISMRVTPSWIRPPGPLNVWKVVDGYEVLADGTKKDVNFSIQEVPNVDERRQEVLDLLCTHFLADEPSCKSLKIKDTDLHGVEDFRTFWEYALDQGIIIGCYKLNSNGAIEELVGVNVIFLKTPETAKDFDKIEKTIKSQKFMLLWEVYKDLASRADVCKEYNVDRSIASFGLSVLPAFRGQKLGLHLLDSRSAVGKKYGISATATFFSAHSSQIQAKRLGYEEKLSINYEDLLDDKGNPLFPNIDSKSAKIMMKKLF